MIRVYTDGACKGNPGPGGWGVFVENTNHKIAGRSSQTTNNRMELTALIHALKATHNYKDQVEILSDSSYCIRGVTEWLNGWVKNGWVTASKTQVKNKDLWERLYQLKTTHCASHLTFIKVKAHCGILGNEIADKLATGEMKCSQQ